MLTAIGSSESVRANYPLCETWPATKSGTLARSLEMAHKKIIDDRDRLADDESHQRSVKHADEATEERNSIAGKKLIEQRQPRPDDVAAFDYQPISRNK